MILLGPDNDAEAAPQPQVKHYSERAEAVRQNGGRVFELCLRRSDRKVEVNDKAERAAHEACAKLLQQNRWSLLDVWKEDGVCPKNGMYRIWFIVVGTKH